MKNGNGSGNGHDGQGDLFGDGKRDDRFDARAGRAIGHVRANDAEASANAAHDHWSDLADKAFKRFAESKSTPFLTHEVIEASPEVPARKGRKAWGAVAKRAKRNGVVRWVGERACKHSHGARVALWETVRG